MYTVAQQQLQRKYNVNTYKDNDMHTFSTGVGDGEVSVEICGTSVTGHQ